MAPATRPAKPIKRIVFISTYPPQRCGIATFSQDLMRSIGLLLPSVKIEVCAINKRGIPVPEYPSEVIAQINQDSLSDYLEAAKRINKQADETLVIVQHEYGIFGGKSGEFVADLIDQLECPVVTTLHTVLDNPSTHMRKTTARIIKRSDKLVVLAHNTVKIVEDLYPGAAKKLELIGHGIHPINFRQPSEVKRGLGLSKHKVLLTFGLLSRNKGIEYVINGLPPVVKKYPNTIYLIVGETHPIIKLEEGESYRQELEELVERLGLSRHVRFMNEYLSVKQILDYLQAADLYIATSLDPEQAVSGTLSYALGAGAAVVTTGFSQAREIVTKDVGKVVALRSAKAMSSAISELLSSSANLRRMRIAAYSATRSMLWSNIADNYIELIEKLPASSGYRLSRRPSLNLKHLTEMTDQLGLVQFANGTVPNKSSGYTLDDNSRALQTINYAQKFLPQLIGDTRSLAKRYLSLIDTCLSYSPMANYLKIESGTPTSQNTAEDLGDSVGRAYYSLQTVAHGPMSEVGGAKRLLDKLPPEPDNYALRPSMFYLLGACAAVDAGDLKFRPLIDRMADRLVEAFEENSSADWRWFEPAMTYANGQLSASLLDAARLSGSETYRKIGLASLDFIRRVCLMGEVYVPIGQAGWYAQGKERALFDQQPEDALAFIQAQDSAYKLTGDKQHIAYAQKAFTWYLGNNLVGVRMYDDASGGTYDGLKPERPNHNQGAESLLAYLQARLIIEKLSLNQ